MRVGENDTENAGKYFTIVVIIIIVIKYTIQ